MKNRAYIPAIIFFAIALFMHYAGIHWKLYTIYTWYDDPLHFMSGLSLGFTFYWILSEFKAFHNVPKRHLWAIVGLTLVCAVFWECYEAAYDLAGYPVGSLAYVVDTAKDIINGVVGSIAALIVIHETYEK
jgi:hypothetical protein